MTDSEEQTNLFEQTGRVVKLVPRQHVKTRLRTFDDIEVEIGKTYRALKAGTIDEKQCNSRVFTLQSLAKVMETNLTITKLRPLLEKLGVKV